MRIFWLGMHKILVRTELPRLRQLGYEVFNPPYLSKIKDQSAELSWEAEQPTTLPPKVFSKLSQYNFFYNKITPEIANLLNQHFDVVVVTICNWWLVEVLRAYKGPIVFRTYGQHTQLSEDLKDVGAFDLIAARNNFYFLPFSEESLVGEHSWLTERAEVIPYCLPEEVFHYRSTYDLSQPKRREIMVTCPNIDNLYFRKHFQFLKANFSAPFFRYYGVQIREVNDVNLVGTIPRDEMIKSFQSSAGYFYSYSDERVCYLPPIEMMVIGGPVVFLKGSLLDSFFKGDHPGRAFNTQEAYEKCQRLLSGDVEFAKSIIANQQEVWKRYSHEYVWPIFDAFFNKLKDGLARPKVNRPILLTEEEVLRSKVDSVSRIWILHHFLSQPVTFKDGQYAAYDGIPRVVRLINKVLLEKTDKQVVITCRREQAEYFYGYFSTIPNGSLRIFIVDSFFDRLWIETVVRKFADLMPVSLNPTYVGKQLVKGLRHLIMRQSEGAPLAQGNGSRAPGGGNQNLVSFEIPVPRTRRCVEGFLRNAPFRTLNISSFLASPLILMAVGVRFFKWVLDRKVRPHLPGVKKKFKEKSKKVYFLVRDWLGKRRYPGIINRDSQAHSVLIPHYHIFQEAIYIRKKTLMYIPDFIPHFFQETGEFGPHHIETQVGRALAAKCSGILTNSQFSKSYMPKSRLHLDEKKIQVVYLPNLNQHAGEFGELVAGIEHSSQVQKIMKDLGGREFIFYPTQARPNKNLAFLLRVFSEILKTQPDLRLLLTTGLVQNPPALAEYQRLCLEGKVLFYSGLSDEVLAWLYKATKCLVFTSLMEGNFPPQIFEALEYETPVVATRLPLITERMKNIENHLLLCEQNDLYDFVEKVKYALENKVAVLERQKPLIDFMQKSSSWEQFEAGVLKFFDCQEGARP